MGKDYTRMKHVLISFLRLDQKYINFLKNPEVAHFVDTDELVLKILKNGLIIVEWCYILNANDFTHAKGKLEFCMDDIIRFGMSGTKVCVELSKPAKVFSG
jgi:hypothetical protein